MARRSAVRPAPLAPGGGGARDDPTRARPRGHPRIVLIKLVFLAVALAPLLYVVYRARGRSRVDLAAFVALIGVWLVAYRGFAFGREFVFHDTLWDHHSVYAILLQWLDSGFAVGWNPFLSGGEPLYLLSNLFLWAELLAFWGLNALFRLPVHDLLNLYFSYVVISFAGFCFLLFTAVFRERVTAFYALVPVLLGGLTISTFGQYMLSPLYLAPLALLSAYLYLRERRVRYLGWMAFFVAISANHYLPHYLLLLLLAFFAATGLVRLGARLLGRPRPAADPDRYRRSLRAVGEVALIAMLAVVALAPVLFVQAEIRELVAPTRGGVQVGERGIGHQPPVALVPSRTHYLVTLAGLSPSSLEYHHGLFYVGWLPVALALYSLRRIRERLYLSFLVTLALVAAMATGVPGAAWSTIGEHLPLVQIRHQYPLALVVTVLIVLLSGFGFERLPLATRPRLLLSCLVLVACIHGTDGLRKADPRWQRPFDLERFSYPLERWPYSRRLAEVPIDTEPLITKRAAATHPNDDFVLFRRVAYQELVRRDIRLASGPLFVFGEAGAPLPAPGGNPEAQVWSLDAASEVALAPPEKRALYYRASDPAQFREKLLTLSACIKGPGRFGLSLQGAETAGLTMPPHANGVRVPVAGPHLVSGLHTYRHPGHWECPRMSFAVGPGATDLMLAVVLAAEQPVHAHIHHVELRALPMAAPRDGTVEIPVTILPPHSPNEVRIRAEVPRDGLLVRRENFHPRWSARVDGVPVAIQRWGSAFQAVPVAAGTHTVDFRFWSPYPILMWAHVLAVLAGYALFARAFLGSVVGRPLAPSERPA